MGISILYSRLFQLELKHDFYNDTYARGLHLRPDSDTQQLLKNARMLFKVIPRGILTFYRAADDTATPPALVPLTTAPRMVFGLFADNPSEFVNITDLDISASSLRYTGNKLLYFTNDPASPSTNPGSPEALTYDLLDGIETHLFTFNFGLAGNPATVQFRLEDRSGTPVPAGKDTDGNDLPTTLVLNRIGADAYAQSVDLRQRTGGRYDLVVLDNTGTTELLRRRIYVNNELKSQNPLGIVEVSYQLANLYNGTKYMEVNFRSRSTTWRYLIVNQSGQINLPTLSLVDNSGGGLGFTAQPNTTVNEVATAVFSSDSALPFRERTLLNLELRDSGSVVIAHLPNATPLGVVVDPGLLGTPPESEIYVFV